MANEFAKGAVAAQTGLLSLDLITGHCASSYYRKPRDFEIWIAKSQLPE